MKDVYNTLIQHFIFLGIDEDVAISMALQTCVVDVEEALGAYTAYEAICAFSIWAYTMEGEEFWLEQANTPHKATWH